MTIGCQHTIHAREHHLEWNPAHPPRLTIAPGESVELNVIDTGGGQITPQSTTEDIPGFDFDQFAPLTGPIAVDGAVPGDALKIEILDLTPSGWGWSMVTPRYGILTADFEESLLKIWHYEPSGLTPVLYNDCARVPIKPFPGIIGVAPGAPGTHSHLPPRNVGGNLDQRDISVGTVLYLPVEVAGGLLSVGDTHAAQGHGELAGTALESPVDVALRIDLVKNANLTGPRFTTPGPVNRHLDSAGYHVTCGVHEQLGEAARLATRQMIELLGQLHDIAPLDAYLLCSVCADLCISEMVNTPVSVVSLYFPRVTVE